MKYFFLLILSVVMISCLDDSDQPSYQTVDDLVQYLDENNITATKTESGLHYVVNTPGNEKILTESSKITISYKVYLLDGTVVEESNPEGLELSLSQVIYGLAEGLKHFDEGSEGTIFIPPALGYGFVDRTNVPAGSVLIFDIKVLKITSSEDEILAYLEENNLEAQKSDTGLYYIVEEEGTGDPISDTSLVTVVYKGYLLDGTEFDSSDDNGAKFDLTRLIPGFSEGVTYFKEGGKGTLLLPPDLAYGSAGSGSIPPNAVIIFDIEVKTLH